MHAFDQSQRRQDSAYIHMAYPKRQIDRRLVFAQCHVAFANDLLADYLALQLETPGFFHVQ